MQKLKAMYLLPIGQVVLAVTLLGWGHTVKDPKRSDLIYVPTPTLVCMGLNAPVLLVRPLMAFVTPRTPTDHRAGSFLDFTGDELLFMCVSAAMWYFMAASLVSYFSARQQTGRVTVASFILCGASALLGIALAAGGIEMLRSPGEWNNAFGQIIEGILFLLWVVALFLPALAKLRQHTVGVAHENSAS